MECSSVESSTTPAQLVAKVSHKSALSIGAAREEPAPGQTLGRTPYTRPTDPPRAARRRKFGVGTPDRPTRPAGGAAVRPDSALPTDRPRWSRPPVEELCFCFLHHVGRSSDLQSEWVWTASASMNKIASSFSHVG